MGAELTPEKLAEYLGSDRFDSDATYMPERLKETILAYLHNTDDTGIPLPFAALTDAVERTRAELVVTVAGGAARLVRDALGAIAVRVRDLARFAVERVAVGARDGRGGMWVDVLGRS